MRRFEFVQGTASKFWEIDQTGPDLTIRWGRIGTNGQSQVKSFADNGAATEAKIKLVAEKVAKGYREAPAATSTIATASAETARTADADHSAGDAAGVTAPQPTPLAPPPPEPVTTTVPATTAAPGQIPPPDTTAARTPGIPGSLVGTWPHAEIDDLPKDLAERALASRRFPQPAGPIDPNITWRAISRPTGLADLNLDLVDPAWRDAAERAVLRDQNGPLPAPDPDVDTVLLLLHRTQSIRGGQLPPGGQFVDHLVARYGLVETIRMYLRVLGLGTYLPSTRQTVIITSGDHPLPSGNPDMGPFHPVEISLRRHLSLASEEVWTTCADLVTPALDGIAIARRVLPALLFPERPELAHHLLATMTDSPSVHWLQAVASDPAALRVAQQVSPPWNPIGSCGYWVGTLIRERGAAAVDVLRAGADLDNAGRALVLIGTPSAVAALAAVASSSKAAMARFNAALKRWPAAGIVALAGAKSTPQLTSLLLDHPDLVDGVRPYLNPAATVVVDRHLAQLTEPVEVAGPDELPAVLVSPPWLTKAKKAFTPMTLEPLPLAPVEAWVDGGHAALVASSQNAHVTPFDQSRAEHAADTLGFDLWRFEQVRPLRDVALAALATGDAAALITAWDDMMTLRRTHNEFRYVKTDALQGFPENFAVQFWNGISTRLTAVTGFKGLQVTYGLRILPALVALLRSNPSESLEPALNVGAVELAPFVARAFATLKTLRGPGQEWLLKFPEHAACGLIAPAVGKAGAAKDQASTAVRMLAAHGHEAMLFEVAGRYGRDDVVAALREVLDNELDQFPTRLVPLPNYWQPQAWRRPVTRSSGRPLPIDSIRQLAQMLSFPTTEGVYAGIEVAKQACTPESLAAFGWDQLMAWLGAGAPAKEYWMLTCLALIGTDTTARDLAPLIRAWPGEKAHARAVTALDVLAGIGSDTALMQLNGIAQKVKFRGLQDNAREKIDEIAAVRGLSTPELEDRLAPDLDLDERGTLLLDLGPRSFTVAFDESLKPFVRELVAGRPGPRLATLPKPRQTDDLALSAAAVARFKALTKDAKTIAVQQVQRLETAMCTRRRWESEVFTTFIVGHPLIRHLATRLVWGTYDGDTLTACFRVDEDGTFTTADEQPFEAGGQVGLPHRLEISDEDRHAFGSVLADYDLLPPFPQLNRESYLLTDADRQATALTRWNAVDVPTGVILGLSAKGWRRGHPEDGGRILEYTRDLGGGREVELDLEPGLVIGYLELEPQQRLAKVRLADRQPFSSLDPIAASELVRDLEAMVG